MKSFNSSSTNRPTVLIWTLTAIGTIVAVGGLGSYLLISGHATTVIQNTVINGTVPLPNTDDGIHIGVTSITSLLTGSYSNPHTPLTSAKIDYLWSSTPHTAPKNGTLRNTHLGYYLAPTWDDYANTSTPGHSLAWFQANHPDWVVYRCNNGQPSTDPAWYDYGPNQLNKVPLDYSNPAVQKYLLDQAELKLRSGYDSTSLDDILFTNIQYVCGVYDQRTVNGVLQNIWRSLGYPADNTTNPKLTADVIKYITYMHDNLKRDFPDKTIFGNVSATKSGIPTSTIVRYFDGLLDEGGFTGLGYQRATDTAWQAQVDEAEQLNKLGKAYVSVAYAQPSGVLTTPKSDQPSIINWVLANYLLVKGGHSYTYISSLDTYYTDLPQYHIAIGHPTSARYAASGVQVRNYSGGLAIVNPSSSHTFTVPLGHQYIDTFGRVLSSVTLPPATGIVLLNLAAPPVAQPTQPDASSTNAYSRRRLIGSSAGGSVPINISQQANGSVVAGKRVILHEDPASNIAAYYTRNLLFTICTSILVALLAAVTYVFQTNWFGVGRKYISKLSKRSGGSPPSTTRSPPPTIISPTV